MVNELLAFRVFTKAYDAKCRVDKYSYIVFHKKIEINTYLKRKDHLVLSSMSNLNYYSYRFSEPALALDFLRILVSKVNLNDL